MNYLHPTICGPPVWSLIPTCCPVFEVHFRILGSDEVVEGSGVVHLESSWKLQLASYSIYHNYPITSIDFCVVGLRSAAEGFHTALWMVQGTLADPIDGVAPSKGGLTHPFDCQPHLPNGRNPTNSCAHCFEYPYMLRQPDKPGPSPGWPTSAGAPAWRGASSRIW
jgi:hypothetical protein